MILPCSPQRAPTVACRPSPRCAWCWSRSRGCRTVPTIRARSSTSSPTSRGVFVINNESGWYEGLDDPRPASWPMSLRPVPTGTRSSARSQREDAAATRRHGHRQQRARQLLHRRRQGAALPERERSLPRSASRTWSRSSSAWALTTRSSSPTRTSTGSSTTRRTGFIRCTSCPFTGGFPDRRATDPADAFQEGEIGRFASIVPGNRIGLNLRSAQGGRVRRQPEPASRSGQVRRG